MGVFFRISRGGLCWVVRVDGRFRGCRGVGFLERVGFWRRSAYGRSAFGSLRVLRGFEVGFLGAETGFFAGCIIG